MSSQNNVEIRQAKELTKASYSLDRNEKRLVYMAIQKVISMNLSLDDFEKFSHGHIPIEISHAEYCELFDASKTNANKEIIKAAESIVGKKVKFFRPDEDAEFEGLPEDNKAYDVVVWASEAAIRPTRGSTTVFFHSRMMSIITNIDSLFTRFLMIEAGKMKSAYSQRLFESLSDWAVRKSNVTFTIDWIFDRYQLPDSYRRPSDFRRRFLKVVVDEINEKTSFENLRATEIKEGGVLSKIRFDWDNVTTQLIKKDETNEIIDPKQLAIITYMNIENEDRDKITKSGIEALKLHMFDLTNDGFEFNAEFMAKMNQIVRD